MFIRLPRRPAREDFRSSPAAAGRRRVATSSSKSLFALSGIQQKLRDYAVRPKVMHTVRNRLDGGFRTSDKGSVGKSIDPKEGDRYSSGVTRQNPPHAPW